MNDFLEQLGDKITRGAFTKKRLERQTAADQRLDGALGKLDRHFKVKSGHEILDVRLRQIDDHDRELLQALGAKATDGVYPKGALTYGDLFTIANTAAKLQNLPDAYSYLKDARAYTYSASGGRSFNPRRAVSMDEGPLPSTSVGRLKVGVNRTTDRQGLELIITPDINNDEVQAEVTDSIWTKLQQVGLPLRNTTWLHKIYKK